MALLESVAAAVLLSGANYADYNSTRQAIDAGMVEANILYGPNAERLAPVKLIATAGEMLVFNTLQKKHKLLAWAWIGTIVAANLAIANHNQDALDKWHER